MQEHIFINKFYRVANACEAFTSQNELTHLEGGCALLTLKNGASKKAALKALKESVDEADSVLFSPVVNIKRGAGDIEVTLPSMKRFFKIEQH